MSIMDQIMEDAQAAFSDLRFHEVVKEKQVVPQGDCNLHCVGSIEGRSELEARLRATWPDVQLGEVGPKTDDSQLVPGSTIGSRHHIREADREVVSIFAPDKNASPLVGPVIVATSRFIIEHPEHAAHSIPAGVYQVLYQRDHALEMARVTD